MLPPVQHRFIDLIRRKRDGAALNAEELQAVVDAVTHGTAPDYQLSAWLMAVFLRGMTTEERAALTRAMTRSGRVLDLSHLPGGKVDKHSTGGIGDKVSLCLAPAVAACGAFVPMVSGRGLGHTGGTLDKLEAIPGLETRLDADRFVRVLERAGFVMGGQSGEIAPADKKLYALRDVTSTVESVPLIASSIMSKKLAEGISGLVLDVKVGSGAFMKTMEAARELAQALVGIGNGVDVRTTAFLTDMDQPLGLAIGNANETEEALDVLRGAGPSDLVELTTLFGGEMLVLGGAASSLEDGRAKITRSLSDGTAMARMRLMVELQGGDPRVCDGKPLAKAPFAGVVTAARSGVVARFDGEALGRAVIALGGGRNVVDDVVDPGVGIMLRYKRGEAVRAGDVLAEICASSPAHLEAAVARVGAAIAVDDEAPARPLILEVIR